MNESYKTILYCRNNKYINDIHIYTNTPIDNSKGIYVPTAFHFTPPIGRCKGMYLYIYVCMYTCYNGFTPPIGRCK